jgi:NDP-sugar pyrophosphorylase family protein
VELRGKALLDWQLTALRDAGIEEAAIVTGYRRELFAERGLTEFHNPRWAETNMVSSLACAQEWLGAVTCIVSYSDIFYSAQAIQSLMESQAALAVTYDPYWLDLWKQRFDDPLVARELQRAKSTVSRELRRNVLSSGRYSPLHADGADGAARRPHDRDLVSSNRCE